MPKPFYRFRKIDNLFGKNKELERQSIYFAAPEQLNDPIEGLKDIYWEGDEVVWRNLFRNYLLCLTSTSINYLNFNEDESIKEMINPFLTVERLSDDLRPIFETISDDFFCKEQVHSFISKIAKYRKNVSDLELNLYFKSIHLLALSCIFERLVSANFAPQNIIGKQNFEILKKLKIPLLDELIKIQKNSGETEVQEYLNTYNHRDSQKNLMVGYSNKKMLTNKKLLIINFASVYIKKLETLMYPNWYTACFMTECNNSSVWGNYGDNHKGVCLIFSPKNEIEKLSLPLNNAIKGFSASKGKVKENRGIQDFIFEPISYLGKPKPVNFFESLGQVQMNDLFSNWFIGKDGQKSLLMPSHSAEWRKSHWKAFHEAITLKTKDWKYENESRLIINDMNGSYSNHDRVLKYEFLSLKGIIFGIKTTEEDKHRVIKVIQEKIHEHNHNDFKFYQAQYCRERGDIQRYELNYLDL